MAGGGTGGHVIPALAIAQELRERFAADIIFIGTERGMETRLVPQAGYPLHFVNIGVLKGVGMARRARTLFDLPRAILRAGKIMSDFAPDAVVGVGGYASGPAMMAAVLAGRPTVAFEPNVVPGFANRIVAPAVTAAAVQFEETCRVFRNCHVTGVPVRRAFFDVKSRPADAPPTLLIFGGSQGAHVINEAAIAVLSELPRRVPGLTIVHQTGERDYSAAQAAYLQAGIAAEVSPFIQNMPEAFARADLLVCRSGASTVAEVTAAGKPAIFVPLRAADDHQRRNAEALATRGAAVLVPEADLTPARLLEEVVARFANRTELAAMGERARALALAHKDAARDIAELVARVAGTQGKR